MAVVSGEELDAIERNLKVWCLEKFPGTDDVDILTIAVPEEGGSSSTVFVTAKVVTGSKAEVFDWVVRIEATDHNIYHKPSTKKQYEVLKRLGEEAAVPVPKVYVYEDDVDVLGAPFFLMDRVPGQVPSTFYHQKGYLAELPAEAVREAWLSAIEAMVQVHLTDPASYQFLSRDCAGESHTDRELVFWDEYVAWTSLPLHPVQQETRRWLRNNKPRESRATLSWGDARLANMIFHQGRCAAVIDWETASLLGAESDLAWWSFFDWYVSDAIGVPRLKGLGDRSELLSVWERLSGRRVRNMLWQDVFAVWRYSVIRARARHLRCASAGLEDPGPRSEDTDIKRMIELTHSRWV